MMAHKRPGRKIVQDYTTKPEDANDDLVEGGIHDSNFLGGNPSVAGLAFGIGLIVLCSPWPTGFPKIRSQQKNGAHKPLFHLLNANVKCRFDGPGGRPFGPCARCG